jgi:hypothetical protein
MVRAIGVRLLQWLCSFGDVIFPPNRSEAKQRWRMSMQDPIGPGCVDLPAYQNPKRGRRDRGCWICLIGILILVIIGIVVVVRIVS